MTTHEIEELTDAIDSLDVSDHDKEIVQVLIHESRAPATDEEHDAYENIMREYWGDGTDIIEEAFRQAIG